MSMVMNMLGPSVDQMVKEVLDGRVSSLTFVGVQGEVMDFRCFTMGGNLVSCVGIEDRHTGLFGDTYVTFTGHRHSGAYTRPRIYTPRRETVQHGDG